MNFVASKSYAIALKAFNKVLFPYIVLRVEKTLHNMIIVNLWVVVNRKNGKK